VQAMKLRFIYLILALVGFVVPYYFLISFLRVHGFDANELIRQLFANRISTFFAVDLLLASVIFILFLRREAARYSIEHWWVYLFPLFTVGLSLAFPLYLYVREGYLEE
jgi:hypothetical protein